ncbi:MULTISPECIES: hypothetical protein [Streptomyces]|uniref:Uncharacterized protein n=1 Tax=Streptomyces sviceus (strain ATCC 29083 / DSM 924 / JCM 4929 / NBRC 13980 / NCIMB 11184 / NRRL 5439 / UC 5370) TaxID=463191 RepID=D6XCB2_STRX2|nr:MULTISPECIES: hypothetical protein [Streptomyces]EFH28374.1 conserved hypothetical protein [Streptomyces sviceus ATCC 29083]MYT03977.1 hypothetical protein [Streptomyces sp. SID5470]
MNVAPLIEAAEIDDAALDAISGGVAAATTAGLHLQVAHLEVCADAGASVSAEGVALGVNAHVGVN